MKIIVTGFEPFGGREINPSQLILEKLQAPAGVTLVKLLLPVEFEKSKENLRKCIESEAPDYVLSIGQAGNAPHISVEQVAVNIKNTLSSDGKSALPDNAGESPVDEPIEQEGPAAYFATLPVRELVKAINEAGVPARISYSAGTYVCNNVMYALAHITRECNTKTGFIHVPFLPEQLAGQEVTGRYAMPFDEMLLAVQTAINHLAGK